MVHWPGSSQWPYFEILSDIWKGVIGDLHLAHQKDDLEEAGVIQLHIVGPGGMKQYKSMVIFRDFPYKKCMKLFGSMSYHLSKLGELCKLWELWGHPKFQLYLKWFGLTWTFIFGFFEGGIKTPVYISRITSYSWYDDEDFCIVQEIQSENLEKLVVALQTFVTLAANRWKGTRLFVGYIGGMKSYPCLWDFVGMIIYHYLHVPGRKWGSMVNGSMGYNPFIKGVYIYIYWGDITHWS